jgi:RNA polymerase sigma-70 factor (ECF subfamily)
MHAALWTTDSLHRRPRRNERAVRLRMSLPAEMENAASTPYSLLIESIARNKDREAFAELFKHFAPRVKSFLIRWGMAAEAAEELAQETLLTVWRRADVYDPAKAAASTWIFAIARNLRIDRARREGRPILEEDPSDAVPQPSPDAVVSAAEDEARVARALQNLPPEQAQVVKLAFFAGKPHSEIAMDLGLPLGTVKSRMRLAMGRLRDALDECR